jgi:hypothetical protein
MKLPLCDVCGSEGKLTVAKYKKGFKDAPRTDVCEDHRSFGEGMTLEEFLLASCKLHDMQAKKYND